MASVQDVFDRLGQLIDGLETLHSDSQQLDLSLQDISRQIQTSNSHSLSIQSQLQSLNLIVEQNYQALQVLIDISNKGFEGVRNLQELTNHILVYQAKQNQTTNCILEKISQNICHLVNSAHIQAGLQSSIEARIGLLVELYKTVHPNEALTHSRLEEIRQEFSKCCPNEEPDLPCHYEPCEAPAPLEDDLASRLSNVAGSDVYYK